MFHRSLIASALLFVASLQAQVSGKLSGSVLDSSGAPVASAEVKVILTGGSAAAFSAKTNENGEFVFVSIRPETYDVLIEAAGFRKEAVRAIKVAPQQEYSVGAIKLEIGAVTEVVEVTAASQVVQLSNAEVSTTLTNEQLRKLPMLNRSPLTAIYAQAGVTSTNRSNTVINGLRTSFTNITLDGINIQDNFIRNNGIDFQPNLLLLDQISEANIGISNNFSGLGGGANQISYVTPSGNNTLRGGVFFSNRNNLTSSNTWFNNRDGIARPFLNQNQYGGNLGGPIKKDKLFYYVNIESYRQRQQTSVNRTILTDTARRGIFSYLSGGTMRQVNVLQVAGVQPDSAIAQLLSQVPDQSKINNFRAGDSRENALRNTGGYSFIMRNNRTRDNATGKLDYVMSEKMAFAGSFNWNRDIVDRPADTNDYTTVPKVTNDYAPKVFSASWRWTPTASTTNEFRGGANLTEAPFITTEKFPDRFVTGLLFSNPISTFLPQGRTTNTYSLMDNATTVKGRHQMGYGFSVQKIKVTPYDEFGIIPSYNLGMSANNPLALQAAQVPGAAGVDVAGANALLANLAGFLTFGTRSFNIKDRTSGFVAGQRNERNFAQDNWAFYFQDNWKVNRRLSVNLGLRWEYFTVMDEKDSLFLLPQLVNNNPVQTLLSNATFDFAGKAVGRPWYNADKNNYGPNIGIAWDPFGKSKTSLRMGYSVNFVNDENIASLRNNVNTNAGLNATSSVAYSTQRFASAPAIPTPRYKVPRTASENYALNINNAQGLIDPNLRTPYVQQYTIGLQHDFKGTIVEVRYVGNHATKAFRAFDFNQVDIKSNGFLDDFNRALNNARLAQAAGRGFDPAFNGAVPGSARLPVFDRLASGGLLGNGTVRNLILQQAAGELAETYRFNGLEGDVKFYANPNGLGMNMMTNYTNSTYNALQVEVTRRFRTGLNLQANYVYGKTLSDSVGSGESRFEAFLDANNPKIERARVIYDLTHSIKANGFYDMPWGKGRKWTASNPILERVVGGWSVSGIMTWNSGTPFSVTSGRGTLNRGARSGSNTANSSLNKSQLDDVFRFRMTGDGPFIASASVIGPDGRAVSADGAAPFSGQAFSQPGAGTLGALQRRMFSGPWNFNLDFSAQKNFSITEKQYFQLRMDSANIFNHPTFDVGGDYSITSVNFGRIGGGLSGRRLIQFTGLYRF